MSDIKKNLISKLIPYGATIIGVIIGFLLSVGRDFLKERKNFKEKKNAIINELKTNLGLLPQKIDLLKQIKNNLKEKQILKGDSISHTNNLYNIYIGDIGYKLNDLERENLHFIYGKLQITDQFLNNFSAEINKKINEEKHPENKIYNYYYSLCEEMITNFLLTQEIIENFLQGNPEKEVTWENDYISVEERNKYLQDFYMNKIVRYIKKATGPNTTKEIKERVTPKIPESEVYNLLVILEKQDIIKRIDSSPVKWRYKY